MGKGTPFLIYCSNFFSVLFHPVLIFFYVFNFLLYRNYTFFYVDSKAAFYLDSVIFLNTAILPVLFTYWYARDWFLKKREYRHVPYLVVFGLYLASYYLFRMIPFPNFLNTYLLALSVGIFLLFLLNLRWKVSMHAMGAGSTLAFFYWMQQNFAEELLISLLTVFFLSVVVVIIRSGSHRQWEVSAGYLLGFGTTLGMMVAIAGW